MRPPARDLNERGGVDDDLADLFPSSARDGGGRGHADPGRTRTSAATGGSSDLLADLRARVDGLRRAAVAFRQRFSPSGVPVVPPADPVRGKPRDEAPADCDLSPAWQQSEAGSRRPPEMMSPSPGAFARPESRAAPPPPGPPPPAPVCPPDGSLPVAAPPPATTERHATSVPIVESEDERALIARRACELTRALRLRGIEIADIDPGEVLVGPRVVRFRVRLAPGASVGRVQGCAEDVARELALEMPPLVDNIPGEPFVAVDVPRPCPARVPLLPALRGAGERPELLPVPAGLTPSGEPMWLDLAELPHLLVAGATNSGKTMFLKSLVAGLADRLAPEAMQVLLVDPKATDFTAFGRLPHLRGGRVVTEPREAAEAIAELISTELPARTRLLQETGCVDLRDLRDRGGPTPPRLVILIDEYADLLQALPRRRRGALEKAVTRLAQRGRSAGLHVVIATQRPTVDVVTGQIKANIPCRISFRLPQKIDSRVVLDRSGAEHLLGQGDMLVLWNDRLTRAQGYFASRSELEGWLSARGW